MDLSQLTPAQQAAIAAALSTTPQSNQSPGGGVSAGFIDDILAAPPPSERLPSLNSEIGEFDGSHAVRLTSAYWKKTDGGQSFKLEFKIEESTNSKVTPGRIFERFFWFAGTKGGVAAAKQELNAALRVVCESAGLITAASPPEEVKDAIEKVTDRGAANGCLFQVRTFTDVDYARANGKSPYTKHYYQLISEEDMRDLGLAFRAKEVAPPPEPEPAPEPPSEAVAPATNGLPPELLAQLAAAGVKI